MDAAEKRRMLSNIRSRLYQAEEARLLEVFNAWEHLGEAAKPELSAKEEVLLYIEEQLDLSGQNEDGGAAYLTTVTQSLGAVQVKQEPEQAKTEAVKTETAGVHWRKEFKLSGQIGEQSSSIGYMSFLRQVAVGRERGYTDSEIVDGVIRAIHPTTRVRGYLEGRKNLDLPTLQTIIRTYYQEKSSTELYQELCVLTQSPKESMQEFIFRSLELKQKLLFASSEDKFGYEVALVEQQFKRAVATGIRDELIRSEIQFILKTAKSDKDLLQSVNILIKQKAEAATKLRSKDSVRVNSVDTSEDILKELKRLRVEVNELKQRKAVTSENSSTDNNTPKRKASGKRKCSSCQEAGQCCFHCFRCGSSEHFLRDCKVLSGNGIGSSRGETR